MFLVESQLLRMAGLTPHQVGVIRVHEASSGWAGELAQRVEITVVQQEKYEKTITIRPRTARTGGKTNGIAVDSIGRGVKASMVMRRRKVKAKSKE